MWLLTLEGDLDQDMKSEQKVADHGIFGDYALWFPLMFTVTLKDKFLQVACCHSRLLSPDDGMCAEYHEVNR